MSDPSAKVEAHRRLTLPLSEVERIYGREARLSAEIIRSQCTGNPATGRKIRQAAQKELADLRLQAAIAARKR